MALIPIGLNTLVWIIIAITAIKLVTIAIKPTAWLKVTDTIYGNSLVSTIVFAILAYLTLDILLDAGITYVQIVATTLFIVFLIGISFDAYSNEMLAMSRKLLKDKNIWKKAWFPVLIWVILFVLAIREIL